jgi:hypothetical protein
MLPALPGLATPAGIRGTDGAVGDASISVGLVRSEPGVDPAFANIGLTEPFWRLCISRMVWIGISSPGEVDAGPEDTAEPPVARGPSVDCLLLPPLVPLLLIDELEAAAPPPGLVRSSVFFILSKAASRSASFSDVLDGAGAMDTRIFAA